MFHLPPFYSHSHSQYLFIKLEPIILNFFITIPQFTWEYDAIDSWYYYFTYHHHDHHPTLSIYIFSIFIFLLEYMSSCPPPLYLYLSQNLFHYAVVTVDHLSIPNHIPKFYFQSLVICVTGLVEVKLGNDNSCRRAEHPIHLFHNNDLSL